MRRRYITENALLEREGKKKEKKEGRRLQFLPSLKAFATKHQRTKEKENQSSDKARLPPNDSIIPSPYDHVQLLELSLKPSSWAHFLYQIYCIGPVGFGLICLTVKNLPKVGKLDRTKVLHGPRTQTYGETSYFKIRKSCKYGLRTRSVPRIVYSTTAP